MSRTIPTTGIEQLDRVWRTTTVVFRQLASLPPAERQHVVNAINEHWQALPVIAAVGGGTDEQPSLLNDEQVPTMPALKGAQRAAE